MPLETIYEMSESEDVDNTSDLSVYFSADEEPESSSFPGLGKRRVKREADTSAPTVENVPAEQMNDEMILDQTAEQSQTASPTSSNDRPLDSLPDYFAFIREQVKADVDFLSSFPKSATTIKPREPHREGCERIQNLNQAARRILHWLYIARIETQWSELRLNSEVFLREHTLASHFIQAETLFVLRNDFRQMGL